MALTPETGAGLADADTYVTIAQADAYAAFRGWTDWGSASDAVKEQQLVEAARYLDRTFDWKGRILLEAQALAWPRYRAYDKENRLVLGVPQAVKDAQIELARLGLTAEIIAPKTEAEVQSITAGSVSVTYRGASQVTESQRFQKVDRLLNGLFHSRGGYGGNFKIARA